MVKLKAITGSSWLLLADDEETKIGLLSKNTHGFTLLAKEAKTHFGSEDEINDFFHEDVFNKVVEDKDTGAEFFVKGFPVNFNTPHEIDAEDELTDLPLYSKAAESKVYHCAGHYCVLFPKGWVCGYCPKYSTISKYEYRGPFKTDAEAKESLSVLRKKHRAKAYTA